MSLLVQQIEAWEKQQINDLIVSYKQKGFKASGNWPNDLDYKNTITPHKINIKIIGAFYTFYMIEGRGPTDPDAPPGEPRLIDIIKKWIRDKGLLLNPFAVTKNIHEKGTKQFYEPDPAKKRLITDAITPADVEDLLSIIQKDYIQRIAINFQKTVKRGNN